LILDISPCLFGIMTYCLIQCIKVPRETIFKLTPNTSTYIACRYNMYVRKNTYV